MNALRHIIARGSLLERLQLAGAAIGTAAALHLVDKVAAGIAAAQAGLLP